VLLFTAPIRKAGYFTGAMKIVTSYVNCVGREIHMKNSFKKAEIISFFLACGLGVLFHFVYEWSGNNKILGLFVPVNESTWEHLKLIFLPILILSIIEYALFGRTYKNFICGKLISILVGMGVTVVLFYTYLGVYGKNVDAVNIIIYFIAMASAYLLGYHFIYTKQKNCHFPALCLAGLLILLLLFWVFTVFPPEIGLFVSP
jgi:hypothetical protein